MPKYGVNKKRIINRTIGSAGKNSQNTLMLDQSPTVSVLLAATGESDIAVDSIINRNMTRTWSSI